jgi:RCC1 and BTB domain-containing protein
MRESTENKTIEKVIKITEYYYDVYYAFLKYLYTDSVDIQAEKAMDLLVLANNYKEEDLKHKCVNIIKSNIAIENVCLLCCAPIKYNLSEFKDFASFSP